MGSTARQSGASVDWLDAELRREKARTAQLEDTVDKQQVALADQAHRLELLEGRILKMQADTAKVAGLEESLQHTRDEVALALSEQREEQQRSQADFLRNRQSEREQDVRSMQEMALALEAMEDIKEELRLRRAEDDRLNGAVLAAEVQREELRRQVAEAVSQQLVLSDAGERTAQAVSNLQPALDAVNKSLQHEHAGLLVTQDALAKQEERLRDLEAMRADLTAQQSEFLEAQRRAGLMRTQEVTELQRHIQEQEHQLEAWSESIRRFTDQHERSRRVLREIQELSQEISQRQDQLRQTQRIAEEQMRREFREWQSSNDKRWAMHADQTNLQIQDQTRLDGQHVQRLEGLETQQTEAADALEGIQALLVTVQRQITENRLEARLTLGQAIARIAQACGDTSAELGQPQEAAEA